MEPRDPDALARPLRRTTLASVPDQEHDHLVKYTFTNLEHARKELCAVLPPELVAQCNWSTLCLERASFVEPRLAETYSDILYKVELGGYPSFIYVLFEHKSTPERLTALQLLGYVVRLLEMHVRQRQQRKESPLPLPAVVPLVFHHSEAGWRGSTDLLSLFGEVVRVVPGLAEWQPNLRFVLDDISELSDEALRARALGSFPTLALWALRDARSPGRLLQTMGQWAEALGEVTLAPNGKEALVALFRYISLVTDQLTVDQLKEAVREAAPQAEETIMTIAEQLRQEGRAEGRAEGRLEGRASVLQELLEDKFGPLSQEVRVRLQSATDEQVSRWTKRILTADSVQAVFGE